MGCRPPWRRVMIASAPLWAVLVVAALLTVFTVVAVAADALLGAWAAGRRVTGAALTAPLVEVLRLLAAQPRTTPAADGVLWLAGWGPNAVLSLVGGYRFVAQGLAYELPLMFALISAAAGAQSLSVAGIAAAQRGHLWFAAWMPAAFAVYLASVYAFSFFGPFGYPAGRDLAGGVLAELSGPDRLVFQAGRWLLLTAGAAMAVPLFLGGGAGPLLPAWAWSAVKTVAVLILLVWGRRRLPVIRADRYAEVAWVVLMPLAIVQALAVALVVLTTGGTP